MKNILILGLLLLSISAFAQPGQSINYGVPGDTINFLPYFKNLGGTNISSGGGGTSLPSQTGNSGKFLSTDGTNPLWQTVSGGTGPSTTDGLPEGTTNLYYTTTRARSAFSAGSGINITGGTISATGGGGGTPAGTSTNIQFNTSGAFDGTPNFSYSKSARALILGTDTAQSGRHKIVFRSYDQGIGIDYVIRGTTNGFVFETEGDANSQILVNLGQHWWYPGQDNVWTLGVEGGFAYKAIYTYNTFYPNRSTDPPAPASGCVIYAKGDQLYKICAGASGPTLIP